MTKEELVMITGGAVSGNFLNYLSKIITTIFDIGRSVGSAINYLRKACNIKNEYENELKK